MNRLVTLLLFVTLLFTCSPKETPRPAPKAAFGWANAGEGTVQFTDQSSEADTYSWTFGDNSPVSTEKNPKHTFSGNGKFSVLLLVQNQSGLDRLSKEVEVFSFAAPVASFSATLGDNGLVSFTNTSLNAQSYKWDFGNGSTSTAVSPSVSYTENKAYLVTLTATGRGGEAKTSQTVTVTNVKPVADFSWTESNGLVTFTNKSKNAETYSWDFGNGKTSKEASPTAVRYLKAGAYAVKLIAEGKSGTATKTATINIASVVLTLADVVDDPAWSTLLPGTWGAYISGEGQKFNNYVYNFSASSNSFKYKNYYNTYSTLSYPETITLDYKFSLVDNILYTESSSGLNKYARLQPISSDEMRLYRIIESSTSYTELSPYLLTRTSDVEKPINQVVTPTALSSALTGIWDQGTYSVYTNVLFDFSAGKNFYQYNSTFQGAKSIQKMEFKIDGNNVMSYRYWNSDFDPAWKKYKVELVSPTSIKLYSIDASGKVSSQPQYMLTKRS